MLQDLEVVECMQTTSVTLSLSHKNVPIDSDLILNVRLNSSDDAKVVDAMGVL